MRAIWGNLREKGGGKKSQGLNPQFSREVAENLHLGTSCFEAGSAEPAAGAVLFIGKWALWKPDKDALALSSCFYADSFGGSWRVSQVRLCLGYPVLSAVSHMET